MELTRKLATVDVITKTAPIEGADNIELAFVRGWQLVTQKSNDFRPNDLVVYFEIDSMIDVKDPRFEFLAAYGVRTNGDGRTGHVLRTMRFRGQYSQGLILPVGDFPEITDPQIGLDVTELLNVVKWDPPIPAEISGIAKGMRPSFVPKTDQERIQNIPDLLKYVNSNWVATEKIDGVSFSVYMNKDDYGVCSRGVDLKYSENNTLWKCVNESHLMDLAADLLDFHEMTYEVVLQGECFGEGIQKNPLQIKGQQIRLFNIIINEMPLSLYEISNVIDHINKPRYEWDLKALFVPIYEDLSHPGIGNLPPLTSVEQALAQVEDLHSLINPNRKAEGIVWRNYLTNYLPGTNFPASFKVISNKYLAKVKD